MVGPGSHVGHFGSTGTDLVTRGGDVGNIALPRSFGLKGGQDDAEGATVTFVAHLGEGLVEKGVPVPHPDVDRRGDPISPERLAQPLGLPLCQLVERRPAPDELVVVRHLVDALGGDTAPRSHDLEKWLDILGFLRPAECDQHDRVEHPGGRF